MPTAQEYLSGAVKKPTAQEYLGETPDQRPNVGMEQAQLSAQLPLEYQAGLSRGIEQSQNPPMLPLRRPTEVAAGLARRIDEVYGKPAIYDQPAQPSQFGLINKLREVPVVGDLSADISRTLAHTLATLATIAPVMIEQQVAPADTQAEEQFNRPLDFGEKQSRRLNEQLLGFAEMFGGAAEQIGSAGRVPFEVATGTQPLQSDIEARKQAVNEPQVVPLSLLPFKGIAKTRPTGLEATVAEAPKPDVSKVKSIPDTRETPFTQRVDIRGQAESLKPVEQPKPVAPEGITVSGLPQKPIIAETPKVEPEVVREATNPPTETPKIDSEGRPFILNNENIQRFRSAHPEWDRLPRKQKEGWIKTAEDAVINRYDENALSIVREAVQNKRPMSASEQAGAMLRVHEVEPQWLKSAELVEKLEKEGKLEAAAIERNRANTLLNELEEITAGMEGRISQEVGKAMSIRRNQRPETVATIIVEAEKAKGSRLSPEIKERISDVFRERDALRKQVDEVTKKWEEEKAKKSEDVARRVINTELRRQRKAVNREKILAEREQIKNDLRGMGYRVNDITGVSVEGLYKIGKLAKNYVSEQALKFEEVIRQVQKDLPELNLTDKEVIQAIETRNPKLQNKLRTDATKRVAQLKQQARLILDIERAEKGIFDPPKKQMPSPPAIRTLQKQLTQLRKEAYKSDIDATRLERSLQLINELQDQLNNQYRRVRRQKPVPTPELADAQRKLAELRRTMRAEDRLADLNEQLRTGDFKIPEKLQDVELPIELQRLQIEVKRKSSQIRDIIEEMRPKTAKDVAKEGVNLLRTLKATADMSATLRQGLIPSIALLRRGEFGKLAKIQGKSIKSFFSEFTAEQIDLAIKSADHHYLREQAGLYLAERTASKVSLREEHFMSKVAEKIPIFKEVVKASDRHMTTSLNLLRAALFDTFLEKYPNATLPELKAWADYVNAASGRGSFGQATNALSYIMFAPRFAASRFQTPYKLVKNARNPRVRNEIAKDLASAVSLGVTALVVADLAGADVQLDPKDPDFGKIRIDDTRIDIWAGFQQPARLIARTGIGATERVGLTGQDLPQSEKGTDPLELAARFAAFKLSPTITISRELFTGKTAVGEPTTPSETAARAVMPIIIESTREAYEKGGRGKAVLTAGLEFAGGGVSTYADSKGRTRIKIRKLLKDGKTKEANDLADNWNDLNPQNRIVNITVIKDGDTSKVVEVAPRQ